MRSKHHMLVNSDRLGRRTYVIMDQKGGSFWSTLSKKFKKAGNKLYKYAKPAVSNAVKELAPVAVNAVGNKLLSEASKRGVSDNLVNLGSKANQHLAKSVKAKYGNTEKLDKNQQLASNFISDRSQQLLGSILGSGYHRGRGIKGLGLKGLSGRSPFNESASTLQNF